MLETTGSARDVGVVAGATAIPALAAGLLMGVVIDRIFGVVLHTGRRSGRSYRTPVNGFRTPHG